MVRTVSFLCCVLLFTVACQRTAGGQTSPVTGVDALPLSIAQVRDISGLPDFTRVLDDDQTVPDDATPEGPCRALFDPRAAFGPHWVRFRVVADEADFYVDGPAPLIAAVSQTVVAYPDEAAARQWFDLRVGQLNDCAPLELEYLDGVVAQPDTNTVVYVNDGWTLVSVLRSDVVVDVSVGALPGSERVADEISRAIVDRIP